VDVGKNCDKTKSRDVHIFNGQNRVGQHDIQNGSEQVLRVNINKFFRTSRMRPPKLSEITASHGDDAQILCRTENDGKQYVATHGVILVSSLMSIIIPCMIARRNPWTKILLRTDCEWSCTSRSFDDSSIFTFSYA
jgi:hypothetical protein